MLLSEGHKHNGVGRLSGGEESCNEQEYDEYDHHCPAIPGAKNNIYKHACVTKLRLKKPPIECRKCEVGASMVEGLGIDVHTFTACFCGNKTLPGKLLCKKCEAHRMTEQERKRKRYTKAKRVCKSDGCFSLPNGLKHYCAPCALRREVEVLKERAINAKRFRERKAATLEKRKAEIDRELEQINAE